MNIPTKRTGMIFSSKDKPSMLEIKHVLKLALAGNGKYLLNVKKNVELGEKKLKNSKSLNILNFSKRSISQFIANDFPIFSCKTNEKIRSNEKRNVGLCK